MFDSEGRVRPQYDGRAQSNFQPVVPTTIIDRQSQRRQMWMAATGQRIDEGRPRAPGVRDAIYRSLTGKAVVVNGQAKLLWDAKNNGVPDSLELIGLSAHGGRVAATGTTALDTYGLSVDTELMTVQGGKYQIGLSRKGRQDIADAKKKN